MAAADASSAPTSTVPVSPARRVTHQATLSTALSRLRPAANSQLEPPADPSLMTFAPREEPERGAAAPPENYQAASAQQLARMPLNAEQTAAVHAPYNIPVSLRAGAGTGKTTTLTARIHLMITDGIPPSAWLHCLQAFVAHMHVSVTQRWICRSYQHDGVQRHGWGDKLLLGAVRAHSQPCPLVNRACTEKAPGVCSIHLDKFLTSLWPKTAA